jgi:hypothetical protein
VFALFPEFVALIKDGWIGEQMAIATVELRPGDFRLRQFDGQLLCPQSRDGQDQARHCGQDKKLMDSFTTAHGRIPLSSRGARSPLIKLYVDMEEELKPSNF